MITCFFRALHFLRYQETPSLVSFIFYESSINGTSDEPKSVVWRGQLSRGYLNKSILHRIGVLRKSDSSISKWYPFYGDAVVSRF